MRAIKTSYILLTIALFSSISGCQQIQESSYVQKTANIYTFADGTNVSVGYYENSENRLIYRLDDGTEILSEEVNNIEKSNSFQTISGAARERISTFYENQDEIYNIEEYLLFGEEYWERKVE